MSHEQCNNVRVLGQSQVYKEMCEDCKRPNSFPGEFSDAAADIHARLEKSRLGHVAAWFTKFRGKW
jgi:hypothetical protein